MVRSYCLHGLIFAAVIAILMIGFGGGFSNRADVSQIVAHEPPHTESNQKEKTVVVEVESKLKIQYDSALVFLEKAPYPEQLKEISSRLDQIAKEKSIDQKIDEFNRKKVEDILAEDDGWKILILKSARLGNKTLEQGADEINKYSSALGSSQQNEKRFNEQINNIQAQIKRINDETSSVSEEFGALTPRAKKLLRFVVSYNPGINPGKHEEPEYIKKARRELDEIEAKMDDKRKKHANLKTQLQKATRDLRDLNIKLADSRVTSLRCTDALTRSQKEKEEMEFIIARKQEIITMYLEPLMKYMEEEVSWLERKE